MEMHNVCYKKQKDQGHCNSGTQLLMEGIEESFEEDQDTGSQFIQDHRRAEKYP